MAISKSQYIWFDGSFVPWDEAQVHVLAHVLHYGSSVFEGIRAYEAGDGPAVFCLNQHVRRMFDSCRIYRMEIPYGPDQLAQAILDTVRHRSSLLGTEVEIVGDVGVVRIP